MIPPAIDGYLEKALYAEERARTATDAQLKARWLGIAFGYRELARFRQQIIDKTPLVPEPAAPSISPRDDSRTP